MKTSFSKYQVLCEVGIRPPGTGGMFRVFDRIERTLENCPDPDTAVSLLRKHVLRAYGALHSSYLDICCFSCIEISSETS